MTEKQPTTLKLTAVIKEDAVHTYTHPQAQTSSHTQISTHMITHTYVHTNISAPSHMHHHINLESFTLM